MTREKHRQGPAQATPGPDAQAHGAALFERAARYFVDQYWAGELLHGEGADVSSPEWLARARRRTVHLARSLQAFAESAPLVPQTQFLHHLMVLPVSGPVAVAMPPFEGMEFIVVGEQFIDLLKFHYQATAGFRLAEFLAKASNSRLDSSMGQPLVYWAGLEWIHDWFKHDGGPVPDLSGKIASQLSLGLDSDALMQGLLFMVLHECGHFALGHVTDGPNSQGIAAFRQISAGLMTEEQQQELAADAWAIRAMAWPNPAWQCTALTRLFVLFGVAHAALRTHTAKHPYLHDRSAHLVAALQANGVAVPDDTLRLPAVITEEYGYRERNAVGTPGPTQEDKLALITLFLERVSKDFNAAGGDAALLAWMQSRNALTRPW